VTPTDPKDGASRNGLAAVLSRPQFSLLVVGQTVSQLGDRLHNMALVALVATAAQTRTAGVEVGKMGLVFLLPTIFAPIVGALVDRMNKRATMIACDLMRAMIVALVPLVYHTFGYIWPAYVVAFFVGLFGVFFNAAKMALIPDLVEHHQLMPANAALASIGRVATVAGLVGGGLMVDWPAWQRIGWEGYEAGFYLDSVSYAVSVVSLSIIMLLSRRHERRHASPHPLAESADVVRREVQHLTGDMRTTFALIRTHHGLRFVFLMVIVLGSLSGAIFVILTAAAVTVLDVGTRGVGFLGGLLAAGMIVGSLFIGLVGSRWNKSWIMIVGCLVMGLFMMGGSLTFSYAIFLPIAFVGGAVLAPVLVSMDTLLHELAPTDSRALVFSTRDLVLGAAFIAFSQVVGFGVAFLEIVSDSPYALMLFLAGLLVTIGSLGSAATQIGPSKQRTGRP